MHIHRYFQEPKMILSIIIEEKSTWRISQLSFEYS